MTKPPKVKPKPKPKPKAKTPDRFLLVKADDGKLYYITTATLAACERAPTAATTNFLNELNGAGIERAVYHNIDGPTGDATDGGGGLD